jgi:hypothetical protein
MGQYRRQRRQQAVGADGGDGRGGASSTRNTATSSLKWKSQNQCNENSGDGRSSCLLSHVGGGRQPTTATSASLSSLQSSTKTSSTSTRSFGYFSYTVLLSSVGYIIFQTIVWSGFVDELWTNPTPPFVFYKIPYSSAMVGDKSLRYQWIRYWKDRQFDSTTGAAEQQQQRSIDYVSNLTKRGRWMYQPTNKITYNIFDCPDDAPPDGYPFTWDAMDVIQNWPIKDVNVAVGASSADGGGSTTTKAKAKKIIHQGLCVFDYRTQYNTAMKYQRQYEVPFVVRNDPLVARTIERWHYRKHSTQFDETRNDDLDDE